MRNFQRIISTIALTVLLCGSAFAGIIECPPAPASSPEPSSATALATTDESAPDVSAALSDAVTDAALSLLQNALSVF